MGERRKSDISNGLTIKKRMIFIRGKLEVFNIKKRKYYTVNSVLSIIIIVYF